MTEQIPYDSTADTLLHIRRVHQLLSIAVCELVFRSTQHDNSKLGEVEKPSFDRETPNLKNLAFGSDEYKESLRRLSHALEHHYANNSHHPEHYGNGVAGMDLFDVIEMVLDWKAASERTAGGELNLDISFNRFAIEPQLRSIISNTIAFIEDMEKELR